MSTQYYCGKCQQNHRYTSKIGQKHLKYKEDPPKTPEQSNKPPDTHETLSQEETLIKPEDPDHISNLRNEIDTNLQEEPAYPDETTENIESHMRIIKINQELLDTNETTENINPDISDEIKIDEDIVEEPPSNRIVRFIRDYQRSYQKGVEKFGVWWKVFQLSIWGIILIFIIIAGIIFVVYLPKIDMINWIIR